jgi:hypothetical protein
MSLLSVVDNDIEYFKKAKKKLMEAGEAEKHDNWTLFYNIDSKIKVYTEDVGKNGCCSVCGTGIINAEPYEILNEIRNKKNWKKMDSMLENSEHIDLSKDQRLIHLMFSGFTFSGFELISKRDIVFIETVTKKNDTIMVTSSKTDLELYPTSSEYIRTDLQSGGWYIKPIDKNRTFVTYYTNVDLKMDYIVPKIMNMFMSKIPTVINKIEGQVRESRENKRYSLN